MKSPFDLKNPKAVIPFDEIDPYNPQNRLEDSSIVNKVNFMAVFGLLKLMARFVNN